MGLNTTGTNNVDEYNVGKGVLYIADLDANGFPKEWRDLGNAPAFGITPTEETLEHFSSRQALRELDKEVVVSKKIDITFDLEELDLDNLGDFFAGTPDTTYLNPAKAGTGGFVVLDTAIPKLGRWYDLHHTVAGVRTRLYDVLATDTIVRKTTGAVVLVLGTDYDLDTKWGRIFLRVDAAAIAAGDDLDYSHAGNAAAVNPEQVIALTQSSKVVALKFISENPTNNDKGYEITVHKCNLRGTGDLALIGEDWSRMSFETTAESVASSVAAGPMTILDHANS